MQYLILLVKATKMKQTKETITRQAIYKELNFLCGAHLKSSAVLTVVFSILLLPLILIFAFNPPNLLPFWRVFLPVLIILILSMLMIINIFWAASVLYDRKLLHKGEFTVTVYTVSDKEEKYRRNSGRIELLHFRETKRTAQVNHTKFQLADIGDSYYAVVFNTKNPEIQLLYACERYEYKD